MLRSFLTLTFLVSLGFCMGCGSEPAVMPPPPPPSTGTAPEASSEETQPENALLEGGADAAAEPQQSPKSQ
jgi:hypothetical protein